MPKANINLTKTDERTRVLALELAAGTSFEIRGGEPKLTGKEELPSWVYEELAKLGAFKDGTLTIPTDAEHAAMQRDAELEQQALTSNPYRAGASFNLTKQIELQREDAAKAEKFKAAASTASEANNPYRKGPTFNLTEQIRLQRDEPQRAEALKAAAG